MEEIEEPWVLADLDCEKLGPQHVTHADFLLATGDDVLVCVELKSGRSIRGSVRQLQESSSYAENELNLSPLVAEFRPVLGHSVTLRTGQRKQLQRERIQFQGVPHAIRLVTCGGRMVDALRGPT